jgi:starch synthase
MSLRVLFCASEVTPFAKTGGLADVTGSLPLALEKLGIETVVVMPRYRGLGPEPRRISDKVTVYFVENELYFNRAGIYGDGRGDYPDNLERFSFFSRQALTLTRQIGFKPDLIHAHDWQTALVPVLLKTRLAKDPFFQKTKTILTVHNLAYQGIFPEKLYPQLELPWELFSLDGFEFYGKINLLKAGLLFADALSTVSPGHAKEIQTKEYGFGLEGVIHKRRLGLRGILNGIDTDFWDPKTDPRIPKNYGPKNFKGKSSCKAALQKKCGLSVDPQTALFGMVSRLAQQKGLDLLAQIAGDFLAKNVQLVLLGSGDKSYEGLFRGLGRKHPKNTSVHLGFDAQNAHAIYAGADFFLMPSAFEPCGLGQMIALRYGAIPVVRKTGGLADTILDVDEHPKSGNGFVFEDHHAGHFLKAIERALKFFGDRKAFLALQKHALAQDFSWERSAHEYKKFYRDVLRS